MPSVRNVVPLGRVESLVRPREGPGGEVVEDEGGAGLNAVDGLVPELGGRAEHRALVALLLRRVVAEKHEETAGLRPSGSLRGVLLRHLGGRPHEPLRLIAREKVRLGAGRGGQVHLGSLGVLARLAANQGGVFRDLLSFSLELSRLRLLLLSLALLFLLDGGLALGALASLALGVFGLALDLKVRDHRLDLLHDPSVFFLLSLCLSLGGCLRRGFGSLGLGLFLLLRSLARLLFFLVRLLLRRARRESLSLGLLFLLLESLRLLRLLHGFNLSLLGGFLSQAFSLLLELGSPGALLAKTLLRLLLLLERLVVRLVAEQREGGARVGHAVLRLASKVVAHERHRLPIRRSQLGALQQQKPHGVQLVAVRRVEERGDLTLAVGTASGPAAVADGDSHHVLQIRSPG